jgi:hypothetical protein
MDRVVHIKDEELAWYAALDPSERLRQANAAFRLYHALHRPYPKPFAIPVDRLEDLPRLEEEIRRRR